MPYKFLLAASALTLAFPAQAAITVLGNSSAAMCYEAAESRSSAHGAIDYCDQALNEEALSDHDLVATHVNRGILLMRKNNLDAAIADFDAAIARNPDQAEAWLDKGLTMLKRDDAAAALPLFTTALNKRTRKPALAYFGRAVAHEVQGDVEAAYYDYKRARAADPDWDRPRLELSRFTVMRR